MGGWRDQLLPHLLGDHSKGEAALWWCHEPSQGDPPRVGDPICPHIETLSWRQLEEQVRWACERLRVWVPSPDGSALPENHTIAIACRTSALPVVELSVWWRGLIVAPVDPSDPRVVSQLLDLQPQLIVVDDASQIEQIRTHFHTSGHPVSLEWISGEPACSSMERLSWRVVCASDMIKENAGEVVPHDSLKEWLVPVPGESISHVIFTSGSTGRPKGCLGTHEGLHLYAKAKNHHHRVQSESVCFMASPAIFDPSLGDICATWMVGATLAGAAPSFLFSHLQECLQATRATHVLTTPSLFGTMPGPVETLSHLQVVALGGELMPRAMMRLWAPRVHLLNTYGITECSVYQSVQRMNEQSNPRELGTPFSHLQFVLGHPKASDASDALTTENLPTGEIWICGAGLSAGYLHLDQLTQQRFFTHPTYGPCFRSGDIATRQSDGSLLLRGRKDWQVKVRGNRIELEEIEQVLVAQCEPIFTRVVCSVWQKTLLVAYGLLAMPEEGEDPEQTSLLEEVVSFLAQRYLPTKMVPRFVFVSDLPQTSSGKVDRKQLAERNPFDFALNASGAPDGDVYSSSEEGDWSEWEKLVAQVWSDTVGLPILRKQTHFIQSGGDSLAALRVCRALQVQLQDHPMVQSALGSSASPQDDFGVSLGFLAPGELLQRPILEDYARHLQSSVQSLSSEAISLPEVSEHTPNEDEKPEATLLFRAASLGMADTVSCLLRVTSPILVQIRSTTNAREGFSALHGACANGHTKVVEILLAAGVDAHQATSQAVTPLHLACQSGKLSVVRALRQHSRVALTSRDSNGQSPFHYAARVGAPGPLFAFLKEEWEGDKNAQRLHRGQNPFELTDHWGRSCLHWAVVNGHRSAVQRLLDYGAQLDRRDQNGETAREIAERRARCGASERADHLRPSVFGDIATLLGGSGDTKSLKKYYQ